MTHDAIALEVERTPDVIGQVERANNGLHESLLRHLPAGLERDDPILDVGCGSGAWLARLYSHGFANLTGIDGDVAQSSCAHARIERADLNQPQWGSVNGRFVLITAIEVIEHIENIGTFVDSMASLLAPGGSILLTTPNVESLASRLRFLLRCELKQFDSIGDPTHLFPVISATLPRVLERRQLRIAERWGFPADGSTITSRGWVNVLCTILRPFLPETIPGDNLCLLIRRM
jgi:2-polyprenyl-3-methyl-5-hydroxy-6-metoxy-1,4-benzoquinol methylase